MKGTAAHPYAHDIPACPHPLCGEQMHGVRSGLFECPHEHRPRSVRRRKAPNYLGLPTGAGPVRDRPTKPTGFPWPPIMKGRRRQIETIGMGGPT